MTFCVCSEDGLLTSKVLGCWQNRMFLPLSAHRLTVELMWFFFSFQSCMLIAGWWLRYCPRKMGSQFRFMKQFHFSPDMQLSVGLHWCLDQGLTWWKENLGEKVPLWQGGGRSLGGILAQAVVLTGQYQNMASVSCFNLRVSLCTLCPYKICGCADSSTSSH